MDSVVVGGTAGIAQHIVSTVLQPIQSLCCPPRPAPLPVSSSSSNPHATQARSALPRRVDEDESQQHHSTVVEVSRCRWTRGSKCSSSLCSQLVFVPLANERRLKVRLPLLTNQAPVGPTIPPCRQLYQFCSSTILQAEKISHAMSSST